MVKNLDLYLKKNIVSCYSHSPHYFFVMIFLKKLSLLILFFKYWGGFELQMYISSQNTIDCYSVFLHDFFPFVFLIFF